MLRAPSKPSLTPSSSNQGTAATATVEFRDADPSGSPGICCDRSGDICGEHTHTSLQPSPCRWSQISNNALEFGGFSLCTVFCFYRNKASSSHPKILPFRYNPKKVFLGTKDSTSSKPVRGGWTQQDQFRGTVLTGDTGEPQTISTFDLGLY